MLNRLLSLLDWLDIFQGEKQPSAKHTRTHWRDCLVDDIKQAGALLIHGVNQLKTTYRKLIETDITLLFDARESGDVRDVCMLCLVQIIEDSTRGDDAQCQVLHAETFQVLGLKMLQQPVVRRLTREDPVVEFEDKVTRTESLLELLLVAPLDQDLLRRKVIQQLVDIIDRAFRCQELACRDIEKGDTAAVLLEMDGGKEIILLVIQYIVVD